MTGAKPDPKIRTPMQWTAATGVANGGFSTAKPWAAINADLGKVNVARQSGDPASLLSTYRTWISTRMASPALRHGGVRLCTTTHPGVFAFVRTMRDDDAATGGTAGASPVLVVANLTGETLEKYSVDCRGLKLGTGGAGVVLTDLAGGGGKPVTVTLGKSGDLEGATPIGRLKPFSVTALSIGAAKP